MQINKNTPTQTLVPTAAEGSSSPWAPGGPSPGSWVALHRLQPPDPTLKATAPSQRSHSLGRSHKSHFPSPPIPIPAPSSGLHPGPRPGGAAVAPGGESSHSDTSLFQPGLFLGHSSGFGGSGSQSCSRQVSGVPRGRGRSQGPKENCCGSPASSGDDSIASRPESPGGFGVWDKQVLKGRNHNCNGPGRTHRARP